MDNPDWVWTPELSFIFSSTPWNQDFAFGEVKRPCQHQDYVASTVLKLASEMHACDEVGLGKTIEAAYPSRLPVGRETGPDGDIST